MSVALAEAIQVGQIATKVDKWVAELWIAQGAVIADPVKLL